MLLQNFESFFFLDVETYTHFLLENTYTMIINYDDIYIYINETIKSSFEIRTEERSTETSGVRPVSNTSNNIFYPMSTSPTSSTSRPSSKSGFSLCCKIKSFFVYTEISAFDMFISCCNAVLTAISNCSLSP